MSLVQQAVRQRCDHKHAWCKACGGCFARKCCTCDGAPKRRAYTKRPRAPDDEESKVESTATVDDGDDGQCPPNHRFNGMCPICWHCRRHCVCTDTTSTTDDDDDEYTGPVLRALDRIAYHDDDADAPEFTASKTVLVNPLLKLARVLRLSKRHVAAAVQSNATRQTNDVASLTIEERSKLLLALTGIVTKAIATCVPHDASGAYVHLRSRLDEEFQLNVAPSEKDQPDVIAAKTALDALPSRSRESRAIRAVFASVGRATADALCDTDSDENATDDERARSSSSDGSSTASDGDGGTIDDPEEGVTFRPRMGIKLYRSARKDYAHMTAGQTLARKPVTVRRVPLAVTEAAVDFLYRPDNSSLLSWGTKTLACDGKVDKHVIQARNRLQSTNRLWLRYLQEAARSGLQPRQRLGRTCFFQLASAITSPNLKVQIVCGMFFCAGVASLGSPCNPQARGSCDAKAIEWGRNNFDKLRNLIKDVGDGDDAAELLQRVDAVERFVKHEYRSHIVRVRVVQSCRWRSSV